MEVRNRLKDIPVEFIEPNPDNPRIVFRQEELDQLLISVKRYGVQVPISVYIKGSRYILIDGERRWRVSKKLNLKTIPAIIHAEPTKLENLLSMFNIHSLREQWDLFTIANKLTIVIDLLAKEIGHDPKETELSDHTGLKRSVIQRCKLLIDLPQRFKVIILKELERPKPKQKLTEDFFIEMERSLKTVHNNFPDVVDDIDSVRDVLVKKYQSGTIKNLVDFRQVAKLATSPKNVSYNREQAAKALKEIFKDNKSSIVDVYNSTVGTLYDEKKLISNFENCIRYIENLTAEERNDPEIIEALINLRDIINQTLRAV